MYAERQATDNLQTSRALFFFSARGKKNVTAFGAEQAVGGESSAIGRFSGSADQRISG
jgi:hypothetical protein